MPKLIVASLLACFFSTGAHSEQAQIGTPREQVTTSDSVHATVTSLSGDIAAGEVFEFTVTLDRAPNFKGDVGYISVGPNNSQIGTGCAERRDAPKGRVYDCTVRLAETAAGGIWTVTHIYFAEGNTSVDLRFKPISFRVRPRTDLIFPTSAEVVVNLNQKQLLRREAGRLQERIQQLKATVSEYSNEKKQGAVAPLVRQKLVDSVDALMSTEREFSKLTTGTGQESAAQIFFDDLRRSYESVIERIQTRVTAFGGAATVRLVSQAKEAGIEALLALALRPMEQNELAYNIVADGGALAFDLEVDSTPEGAAVSYYRRGDPPRANPDQTRAVIPKLPYAIWIIRFEKPGYKTEEREHDPFRESNHVVHIDLQK